jgi:hypothetical protein
MRTVTSKAFQGIPSFFRGCCRDVASRRVDVSYSYPAYELVRHLERLIPYSCEVDEWEDEVAELVRLLEVEDGEAVWTWFTDHYPKCMALVPRRRRAHFLDGVYSAARDFGMIPADKEVLP